MHMRAAVLGLMLGGPTAAAPPTILRTAVPFDTVMQCLRDRLSQTGRVTAINTAAGAMLDYAFDSLGPDGRVAAAHLSFTIEDHGSERTIAAAAAMPADAALAQQYLRQAGTRCAGGEAHGSYGAP